MTREFHSIEKISRATIARDFASIAENEVALRELHKVKSAINRHFDLEKI